MLRKLLLLLIILLNSPTAFASSPTAHRFEPPRTLPSPRVLLDKSGTTFRQRKRAKSLWPGSRFTELDRQRALHRGLRFIYSTALNPRNFAAYGSDYLWCFYTLSTVVRDEKFKQTARQMGVERARYWRRTHRSLPRHADALTVADFVFGSDSADGLGVRDERLKEQLRVAAARYSARDYLLFDPLVEPPPADVPGECEYDQIVNSRGSKTCRHCRRPLKMRTRYDVWYDALITAYSGDHYGVKLGARYADVLKWLPSLRPLRGHENGANADFYDTVYAVTHVVYTLNNYSQYRLSPNWLPQEYRFLKDNLREAIAFDDADMLGEFMDSLRAFGLTSADPLIRSGMEYYLSHQNADGSWGDVRAEDIYDRYHPTWNAIAGLSEYSWRAGEGLSFPEIMPLLQQWERENSLQDQSPATPQR